MNVKIIAVGKLKKSYIKEGVDDFSRRLSKYVNLKIIEVGDEKNSDSESELTLAKQKEGERILSHIKDKSFVCALDIKGRRLSTQQFATFFDEKMTDRSKELIFVIGGSVGLCDSVLNRADFSLSFSNMTFPHGLMRLILLEQLYRAQKILRGEPYHK